MSVLGPCIPEGITSQYSLTIGQVQWDAPAGADYFTVSGETDQGLTVSCNTTDTYCVLYNMDCGQMYNITVTSHNHVCTDVSISTEEAAIITGEETQRRIVFVLSRGFTAFMAYGWGALGFVLQPRAWALAC